VFSLTLLQAALLGLGSGAMAMRSQLTGVAWAAVMAACVPAAISLRLVMRHAGIRPTELCDHLRPLGGSALAMACVLLIGVWARGHLGIGAGSFALAQSIGWLSLSVLVYVLGILRWDRGIGRDLSQLLRAPTRVAHP